jgi:hypothetical protein
MNRLGPLLIVLGIRAGASSAQGTEPVPRQLEVRIDPRVELLSIVFRLAGNDEYNMENSQSPYSEEVDKAFEPFREHPAVRLARELREKTGVSFDAVMSMAVHLADDVSQPKPRAPLDPRPSRLDNRWSREDADRFIAALGDFVKDTDFTGFIARNHDLYEKSAARFAPVINRRDYIGWFDRFLGSRPHATFCVIVGMLNGGGNYGVGVRYADGREEISPVIGVPEWDAAGLPVVKETIAGTIVHELCHSYTNAYVDRFADRLEAAGDTLYARNTETMKSQAYGSGRTVLYESLVRTVVTHYTFSADGAEAGRTRAAAEMRRGFKWILDLNKLLDEYDANRTGYPGFESFMPRVVEFFDETAANYDALLAKFPRVVSMTPENSAKDVDPATPSIYVAFDRPMADGWSFVGGGPDFPKLDGSASYDPSGRMVSIGVKLEPAHDYRFSLNGGRFCGFVSEEGYPLEPVPVAFRTRGK